MKHYAKLTGFLLRYLLRITAAGMLVLAAAQLGWLFHTAPQADYAYLCYQEFVSSPSRSLDLNRLFFYGLLLLLCALDLWIFQAFKGKKSLLYSLHAAGTARRAAARRMQRCCHLYSHLLPMGMRHALRRISPVGAFCAAGN